MGNDDRREGKLWWWAVTVTAAVGWVSDEMHGREGEAARAGRRRNEEEKEKKEKKRKGGKEK